MPFVCEGLGETMEAGDGRHGVWVPAAPETLAPLWSFEETYWSWSAFASLLVGVI